MFSVPWESRASLERTSPDLNQWEFDNWGSFMIGMRNDTAPYDDLRVRQALAAAIDMRTIIDNVFGGSGVMLNQPFPAVWPETFYTPLDQLNADTQRAYSYDPDWARELLAEAGYPDGFETEIILPPSGRAVDLFSLIASYWAEIGVTLELQPTDEATIRNLERTRGHTHMISYEGSSPHPGEAIWASWGRRDPAHPGPGRGQHQRQLHLPRGGVRRDVGMAGGKEDAVRSRDRGHGPEGLLRPLRRLRRAAPTPAGPRGRGQRRGVPGLGSGPQHHRPSAERQRRPAHAVGTPAKCD